MENIIFNELRYRGYKVYTGEVDYFEKSEDRDINNKIIYKKKTLEVDFVAEKGDEKIYIQSTLSLDNDETIYQEKKIFNGNKRWL